MKVTDHKTECREATLAVKKEPTDSNYQIYTATYYCLLQLYKITDLT